MKQDGKGIEVSVLDRTLRIACNEEEKPDLLKAVEYLDAKMREIRNGGRILGSERIALMAALNITHELLLLRSARGFDIEAFKRRMQNMAASIDEAMSSQEDLF
jgi:cell division protein ZapA